MSLSLSLCPTSASLHMSTPSASPAQWRMHPRAPHHLTLEHHALVDETLLTQIAAAPVPPAKRPQQHLPPLQIHSSMDAAAIEEICDLEDDSALTPYQLFSASVDENYQQFLRDVNLTTAQRQAEHEHALARQRRERAKQLRLVREQREELQRRFAPLLHSARSYNPQSSAFGTSVAPAAPDLSRRHTEPTPPSDSSRFARPSSSPQAGSSGHSALMWSPTPPTQERRAEEFKLPLLQQQRQKDAAATPTLASTAPNSPLTSPSSARDHRRRVGRPSPSLLEAASAELSPSSSPPFRARRDSYAQQAVLPSKSPRTVRIAKQNARRHQERSVAASEEQQSMSQSVPASPVSPVASSFQLNSALSLGCGSSLQPLHMTAQHGSIFMRAHQMLRQYANRGWLHFGQAQPVLLLQSEEELKRALSSPESSPPSIPFSVILQLLQWWACQFQSMPLRLQESDTVGLLVQLLQVLAHYVEYSEHRYSLMSMDDSLKFLLRINKAAVAASSPHMEEKSTSAGGAAVESVSSSQQPQMQIQLSSLHIIAALVAMETSASSHSAGAGTGAVSVQTPHPQLPAAQLDKLELRMQRLLQQFEIQPQSLMEICLRICSRLLVTHKRHEQLCSGGFVSTLLSVMAACPSLEQVQLSCVECISELLNCGRIQQRHRMELEHRDRGLRLLLAAQTAFPANVAIQGRVLNSLAVLSAEVTVKQKLLQQSILLPVVQMIRRHSHAAPFLAQSFQTLSSLVIGEPAAEEKLVSLDIVELVVQALRLHGSLPSLAENALLLLRSLVLPGAKVKQQVRFLRVGGFELLVGVMRAHARSANVVLNAWQLLSSFTGSSPGQASRDSSANSELVQPIPFSTLGGSVSTASLCWHSLQGLVPDLLPLAVQHLQCFNHVTVRALQVAVCRPIVAIVQAFAVQRAQLPRELNPADVLLQQGVLTCLVGHIERHGRSRPSLLLMSDVITLLASTASTQVAAKEFAPFAKDGATACKRALSELASLDTPHTQSNSQDKLIAKITRLAQLFAKYNT